MGGEGGGGARSPISYRGQFSNSSKSGEKGGGGYGCGIKSPNTKIKQIPKMDILYSRYSRKNKKTTKSVTFRLYSKDISFLDYREHKMPIFGICFFVFSKVVCLPWFLALTPVWVNSKINPHSCCIMLTLTCNWR